MHIDFHSPSLPSLPLFLPPPLSFPHPHTCPLSEKSESTIVDNNCLEIVVKGEVRETNKEGRGVYTDLLSKFLNCKKFFLAMSVYFLLN